jgi:hypothetical protein
MHTRGGGGGRGCKVQKLLHTNEIKHKKGKKGDPLDFLKTPSNPLKIIWPNPPGPSPPPNYFASIEKEVKR